MEKLKCEECQPSLEAFTWRCAKCRKVHHMHDSQLPEEYPGALIVVACPGCKTLNGIRKPGPPVVAGMLLSQRSFQPRLIAEPMAGVTNARTPAGVR